MKNYNSYHTIKAFKDAVKSLGLDGKDEERLKRGVFHENARDRFTNNVR